MDESKVVQHQVHLACVITAQAHMTFHEILSILVKVLSKFEYFFAARCIPHE